MNTTGIRSTSWQDWMLFALRWVFLVVIILMLPRGQSETSTNLALPAIVLVSANIFLAVCILYPALHKVISGVIIVGDWAITAAFVGLVNLENVLLLIGIVGFITISGLLPLWADLGAFGQTEG